MWCVELWTLDSGLRTARRRRWPPESSSAGAGGRPGGIAPASSCEQVCWVAKAGWRAHEAMASKEEAEAMRKQVGDLEAKLEKMMVEKVRPNTRCLELCAVSLAHTYTAAHGWAARCRTRSSRSWTRKSMPRR